MRCWNNDKHSHNTYFLYSRYDVQWELILRLPDRLLLPLLFSGPRCHFLPGPGSPQEADQGPPGHHGEGQKEPGKVGEAAAAAAGAGDAAEGGAVKRGNFPSKSFGCWIGTRCPALSAQSDLPDPPCAVLASGGTTKRPRLLRTSPEELVLSSLFVLNGGATCSSGREQLFLGE